VHVARWGQNTRIPDFEARGDRRACSGSPMLSTWKIASIDKSRALKYPMQSSAVRISYCGNPAVLKPLEPTWNPHGIHPPRPPTISTLNYTICTYLGRYVFGNQNAVFLVLAPCRTNLHCMHPIFLSLASLVHTLLSRSTELAVAVDS
jgi:hypothetical protein